MKKIIIISLLLLGFSSISSGDFHDEVLGKGPLPLSVLEANIKAWVEAK